MLFKRAKQKKVEVKSETPLAVEIKVNVKPPVKINEVVTLVDGEKTERVFKIQIDNHDVITLQPRQYHELFIEMLRHKEADDLIHDIALVHAEEHVAAHEARKVFGVVFDRFTKAAEKAING